MQIRAKNKVDNYIKSVEKIVNTFLYNGFLKEEEEKELLIKASKIGKEYIKSPDEIEVKLSELAEDIHTQLIRRKNFESQNLGAQIIYKMVEPHIEKRSQDYALEKNHLEGLIARLKKNFSNPSAKGKKIINYVNRALKNTTINQFKKNKVKNPTHEYYDITLKDNRFSNILISPHSNHYVDDEFKSIDSLFDSAGIKKDHARIFLLYKNGEYKENKLEIPDGEKITYQAVADHLQIPMGTVKFYIHLAKEALKEYLRKTYPDDEMIMYYVGQAKQNSKDAVKEA